MPDLPGEVLSDLTDEDWTAINRIGEELEKEAPANETVENQTDDSTEEQTAEADVQTEAKPDAGKMLSQADVDRIVKERLAREKEKSEKAAEKARREAAEKAAEENEEFKTLAESRAERISELEAEVERLSGVEEKNTTYAETLNSYAEARLGELNLPKGVTRLLESFDPKEKLDWLSENAEDFTTHERVPPAEQADETGTPEADEAARQAYEAEFARNF